MTQEVKDDRLPEFVESNLETENMTLPENTYCFNQ